jgi:hypothetical protein
MEWLYNLALAVLQLAVQDLQHGSPHRKADAKACVQNGGLNHWIDIIATTHHSRDRIHKLLNELSDSIPDN